MSEEKDKLFDEKPAPYPATASSEMETKNIFQSLIDTRYIKGEVRSMDKYPNSDGILEITDEAQFPVGKIDIQLKTLQPRNYHSPGYSIDRSFIAYCQTSVLPVILVVVNRKDKIAYWRHMDADTLRESRQNIVGVTYALSIPSENKIDGIQNTYIAAWTQKAKEVSEKLWNYDSEHEKRKALELEIKKVTEKLK